MTASRQAFTLVEILVTLAVSSIIMVATYGAYDIVKTQYDKNLDIANMHTSGRAIMRIIERDVRMAGFEYRDKDAKVTYGTISNPLTIKDSGNKCCDEVTVIYDYFDEESKKAERIRIRYWAGLHTSNKGSRHRLYKQKDILGQNKTILAKPKLGTKDVMADYIEDLQFSDGAAGTKLTSGYTKIDKDGKELLDAAQEWSCVRDNSSGFIWEVKTTDGGVHDTNNTYRWRQWSSLINQSNIKMFCGFNQWRAPNKNELEKLVDKTRAPKDRGRYKPPIIDNIFFPNTKSSSPTGMSQSTYWTNNEYRMRRRATGGAYYCDFEGGRNPICGGDLSKRGLVHLRLVCSSCVASVTLKLVDINLILRTKNQYGKDRTFKKKDYHSGNFKLDKTDKYKRDTFSSTVLVRNLAL
jgi:prepilin-type N-terminal cleavage/methylation domain-containing protein